MARIFIAGVCVFVITTLVLFADISLDLSIQFWWFDIVEHFLGGVLAALIGLWWGLALTGRRNFAYAIIGAVVLGALVEVVEYMLGWGISSYLSPALDTSKDVIVDLLGAYPAWVFAKRRA